MRISVPPRATAFDRLEACHPTQAESLASIKDRAGRL